MTTVLHAPADLTVVTAAEVRTLLLEALADTEAIELDLAAVEDLDTAGLQLLLLARREARARELDLSFGCPSPVVLATLELVGLSTTTGEGAR